jgi:hypothetical protein
MDPYPSPHTEAWCTALAACNPTRAQVTRMIVGFTGRPDGCSLCGDPPANAYQLVNERLPFNARATLRLCPDCHSSQRVTVAGPGPTRRARSAATPLDPPPA